MSDFSTVAVLWRREDPTSAALARDVVRYLGERAKRCLPFTFSPQATAAEEAAIGAAAGAAGCQLAVVLGGDGTLLTAARALAPLDVPLLGVNLGRLGFLVDLSPSQALTSLGAILDGQHCVEERLVLDGTVTRDGQELARGTALNEVAVHKWDSLRAIELETRVAGRLLYRQRADGLIVSTPTGSTAYALSAGGPILYPDLRTLLVVPVCQHTLGIRPVVIGVQTVTVTLTDTRHAQARGVWDGHQTVSLRAGDVIEIKARTRPLRLMHPQGYDYFELLRSKLHWAQ